MTISSSITSLTHLSPSSTVITSATFLLNPHKSFFFTRHLPDPYSFLAFSVTPISSNTFKMKAPSSKAQHRIVYPDPIPEFAEAETKKFRSELLQKLSKNKESFAGDLDKVVEVCAEIFGDFLHKEYGGPGTLLVEPFTDMLVVLKEKNLPGAPAAARAALLWAQNYLDEDWEAWNSQ